MIVIRLMIRIISTHPSFCTKAKNPMKKTTCENSITNTGATSEAFFGKSLMLVPEVALVQQHTQTPPNHHPKYLFSEHLTRHINTEHLWHHGMLQFTINQFDLNTLSDPEKAIVGLHESLDPTDSEFQET